MVAAQAGVAVLKFMKKHGNVFKWELFLFYNFFIFIAFFLIELSYTDGLFNLLIIY